MKTILIAATASLIATGCATAHPTHHTVAAKGGVWRLDASRCPDLVEDRIDRRESIRDERVDYGPRDRAEDRADRRESRRDRAVVTCPRSAFTRVYPRG